MKNITRALLLLSGIFFLQGWQTVNAQTATFNWNGHSVSIAGYPNDSGGAVQTWTVPGCVTTVTVTAVGGAGGNAQFSAGPKTGGLAASLTGTIPVTPGHVLYILVGAQGSYGSVDGGGGGGGSFIWDGTSSTLLVVAGGGGGAGINESAPNGQTTNTSAAALEAATPDAANKCGAGGVGGRGGAGGSNTNDGSACGGAGWSSNGGVVAAGSYYYTGYGIYPDSAFKPGYGGVAEGAYTGDGGYGGGAGGGYNGGGGAGGYNGGGGGKGTGGTAGKAGGGGGSFFNNTVATSTTTGTANTNGSVVIKWNAGAGVSASISSFTDPTCNGGTGTATGSGSGGTIPYTYSWNPTGQTNATATGLTAGSYTVTVKDNGGCSATASVSITQPTVVTAVMGAPTYPLCNAGTGSATVTGGGGTTPYTYAWAPSGGTNAGGTGLTAGSYTVTVKDNNGCAATASVSITQPTVVTAVMGAPTYPLCNAGTGSATVTGGGGTVPYTYSWTPSGGTNAGGTGLTAGSYTVTVKDNNGCAATASVSITQPTVLTTPMSMTAATCGGTNGTATVTAGGGTSPYTYSWNPSAQTNATATGLSAGTYTVTVKDNNGCSQTSSITVTSAGGMTATIGVTTGALCNGGSTGSATVNPAGGTLPYTYSWNPSAQTNQTATGLSAGNYTVTVTDNGGCLATASASITQPTVLTTPMSMTAATCGGTNGTATVTAGGGTSPYTYSWNPSAQTNATATGLSAGTYTVTVKDNNGCSQTSSITVTSAGGMTATIGVTTGALCNGGSTGSTIVNPAGGTLPYTYSWNPSAQTNQTATGLSAGNYTVTVTDNGGCTATASVSITQPTVVTAVMGAPTYPICNGGAGSATVTPGGGTVPYTYSWAPSGGTNATGTGLTAGSYTVTVKDNNGCAATASVSITQPIVVTAVMGAPTYPICNGGVGSATVTPGGGTVPYTYSWAPGGGTNATGTGLTAGSYTVTVKDNGGCLTTASVSITQPIVVTAVMGAPTYPVCNGGAGSVTVTAGGGTVPYTYSWAPSGGTNATGTGLTAGSYTVTVKDNRGCLATASVSITQPIVVTAVMGAPTYPVCNGGAGSATVTAGGGTAPYTYSWAPSGGTNATGTGLTAGSYTVTVKDNGGCLATASASITQPIVVTAIMGVPTYPICNGGVGSATVTAGGGTAPYTYSWAPSGGTNATGTGLTAGSYTVTVKDNGGCLATASASITQPIVVIANITGSTAISCSGGTNGTATAIGSGGTGPYSYMWAPSANTNAIGTGLSAGTYIMTVTDHNGCAATASVSITQPAAVAVTMGASTNPTCNGGTGSATANPATGGTSPYNYLWSSGGGTNLTASNLSAGTYTITATDARGCSGTTSVAIIQPAAVGISISSVSTISCQGIGSITSHAATGGTAPYIYSWAPSGGTNLTASNLSAGTYTITVTDNNGCSASAKQTITFPAALTATASTSSNVSCYGGNTGNAIVSPSGGAAPYTYSWFPGGRTNANEGGLTAGTYTITVTDNNGCTATAKATITEPAGMVITTNKTDASVGTCNGMASVLVVSGGTAPYQYLWNPGGGTTDSINSVCEGAYCCTVTQASGCSQDICIIVETNTGVGNIAGSSSSVNIYPNPTTGQFTINGVEKGMRVEIYDYIGRQISNMEAGNEVLQVNIADRPNGIYLIRILSKEGSLVSESKVVKTQ